MPAQKSAKPPKSAPGTAAKAVPTPAAKAPAKAAAKKSAPAPAAPAKAAKKEAKPVPVKSSAELTKAADELLKKKPARAKAAAAAAPEEDDTPKKRPGRPAKAAGAAEAKAPAKRGRKPKAAASDESGDDTDLSDIEADLEGEVEEAPEAAATVEKVKPLRMKISKAKERALMKEFGLDETVLTEEEMLTRRQRLKALIKLGKTRGYLTHGEINDHLPDKLVDAETLEVVISMLNDMGVAVYEQTPDAETLLLNNTGQSATTEEEAEEEARSTQNQSDCSRCRCRHRCRQRRSTQEKNHQSGRRRCRQAQRQARSQRQRQRQTGPG